VQIILTCIIPVRFCTVTDLVEYAIEQQRKVVRQMCQDELRHVPTSSCTVKFPEYIIRYDHNYCSYCDKQCNSEAQYRQHCGSEKHRCTLLGNDDEHQDWKHRRPPIGGFYELCTELVYLQFQLISDFFLFLLYVEYYTAGYAEYYTLHVIKPT